MPTAASPLLAAQVRGNGEDRGGPVPTRAVALPRSMEAHPQRLKQLFGCRGVHCAGDVAKETVAPSVVELLEGSQITAAGVCLHQRLIRGRPRFAGPGSQFGHPASSDWGYAGGLKRLRQASAAGPAPARLLQGPEPNHARVGVGARLALQIVHSDIVVPPNDGLFV